MWRVILFYYFSMIASHQPSGLEAVAFGIFFLGGIKGPSRMLSSVLVTLMMVMLYASEYFKAPCQIIALCLQVMTCYSFHQQKLAEAKGSSVICTANKTDQEAHTDQGEGSTLLVPSLKPDIPF